jgi:diaminopimelate decarboxylase
MARPATIFPVTTGRDESGQLQLAGYSVPGLAEQHGTPLYVYDGATVREHVNTLKRLLELNYPALSEITYAAKAYFSLGFARKMAEMGLGVDVVSLGELHVATKAGFRPGKIHLHGNNKSEAELSEALDQAIQAIVVDSLDELNLLEQLAGERHRRAPVWLRITPGVEVDTHPYRMTAHAHSKFGLAVKGGQAADAIDQAQSSRWLHLTGLHMHLGSQVFEVEPYLQAVRVLADLAEKSKSVVREISPGGGWGVPYTVDDPEPDPRAWIEGITGVVREEFERRNWRLPKLVIEPGRWLAARAGVAVYSIGACKKAADGSFVVAVDGGMADNPRPALYQAKYTCVVAEKPGMAMSQRARVVGKFCESGDELISETWLPDVEHGEHLVIPVAGAYQLSMASNYNLSTRPAVLWLEQGKVEVLQRREHPDESGWWMGD